MKNESNAVADNNVMVVGSAGTMATGNTFQSAAHATGLMFTQMVQQQNNQFQAGLAATGKDVTKLLRNTKGGHVNPTIRNAFLNLLESDN